MATRQKTIEFVAQSNSATLTAATNRDATVTVYIPETVVAFRCVTLKVFCRGDNTVASSLTAPTLGVQVGAGAMSSVNLTNPVANSGENEAWSFVRDVTSVFTADWSGTSQTVTMRFNGSTTATTNHACKLTITYDYDDTATTHIKTIRVPIESTRSTLTTSFQTLGGATAIPDFGGSYLPEASVVVRQVWVELWGNEATNATTDFTLQARVNGGTAASLYRVEAALNSACWAYAIHDITAEDLTAARSYECLSSGVTSRFDNLGGMVCVTYEFNATTTTTVYNSLLLGAFDTAGWMGGTTVGNQDAWGRDIRILEPATITLKESAMCLTSMDLGGFTWYVSAGAQTPQAYTATGANLQCGGYSVVHRIDASGQAGSAGITLARGPNSYIGYVRSGTANAGWNCAGFLILNYTSGKSTQGVGAHNHTCWQQVMNSNGSTSFTASGSSVAPAIPETSYWLTGCVAQMFITTDNSTNGGQAWNCERQSGEGEGDGWEAIYFGQYRTDNENCNLEIYGAARRAWRRYPGDPETDRMDIETARVHRIDTNPPANVGGGLWYTYHAMTWTVSGTISNSSGGTVDLMLFDATDDTLLLQDSRTGNGAYSFTWYQDTREVYVAAYESGTLTGCSARGYPS